LVCSEGETSMVVDKSLLRRSFAVLIAASMLAGLFVVSNDAAALTADALIKGNVTDGSEPVPDSYVKVMLFTAGGVDINYTFTDASGDYEIGVPGGFDYMLFVANGSYYMSMQPVSVLEGETRWANFTLDPVTDPLDVTIMGYVRDDIGTPITEGHVLGIVNDPTGGDTPHYANVTVPDTLGYFEINVIEGVAGGGAILMDYPGFSMIENTSDDPLNAGESYWFNITVEPPSYSDAATIHGQVTASGSGLPLESVLVSVEVWDEVAEEGYSNYTFTDEDGYYNLNVSDGSARIMMTKGGYTMAMFELEVSVDDVIEQNAKLTPTNCVVRGNVTDGKTSDPITFATVFIWYGSSQFSIGTTDDSGAYLMRAVDGEGLIMSVELDDYSRGYAEIDLMPGDEKWQDFELWPVTAWIEGTVTDFFTGLPIEDAHVWVDSMYFNDEGWTDMDGKYWVDVPPGTYDISVEHWNYRSNMSSVEAFDEAGTIHDVELLPWDMPEAYKVYGWVNDSVSGTGIWDATVQVQLPDRSYWNETRSDWDGYYEMFVPAVELDYLVTAYQHYPAYGVLDATAAGDLREDFLLDPDMYRPNVTYTQDPVENITWFNPTVIDAEVEELNLERLMLFQSMFWKLEDDLEVFLLIDMKSTSFNPLDPSDSLYYEMVDDNYTIHEEWDATASAGGWLDDGVESHYIMANEQWWGPEMYHVVWGFYSNSTLTDVSGSAYFDGETGELVWFWLEGEEMVYPGDDTATFAPQVMVLSFNVSSWTGWPMIDWTIIGQLNADDMVFAQDDTVPSGDYRTVFAASDFGRQADLRTVNMTVDNDPPLADAGDDWTEVVNTTATIDGSASSDNVGIVSYVWDFEDDGTPMQLLGETVEYEFTLTGTYALTLTVTDGAGHESTDSVNVTVTEDAPPVADAGADMTVDEDTLVAFDAVGSSDDVGIDNYTWTIVEMSLEMYGPTPEYTFNTPDVYTIELVVTDTIGQESSTDAMLLTVLDVTDPVANAGLDVTVPSGATVTLNGMLSDDNVGIVSFTWTFSDDGSQSLDGEEADYTFDNVGVFVITLTVEDDAGNSDTDQVTVTVYDATDPVADAGPDQTVAVGTEVILDGSNSTDNDEVVSWVWTFEDDGDDVTLDGETADYTFENVGVYVVTLTVEDDAGNSDEDTVTIRVSSPPVADAGSPITVTVGATVTFDGSESSDDIGVENYTWTFTYDGETETLYGVAPSFTFDIADVYTVTLTVEDASGSTDTDTVVVTVEEDEDDGTAEDKSFLEEYWWLLAIIGAIVAVAAVATAMMKPKKGVGGASESPAQAPPPEEDLPPPPDDEEL
jgi:PKD repeat protein